MPAQIKNKMKNWNLKRVITDVNSKYGAPMGRSNVGSYPITLTFGRGCRIVKKHQTRVYTKHVPLDQGYDAGGAYWGIGAPLYVSFTADLSYIEFNRA